MTPSDLYIKKQKEGAISADHYQAAAIASFDRLYFDIQKKSARTFKARVGQFFGRSKNEARGIYIWGGVGRGKTMLMDIFVLSVSPLMPTRRVHFHDFMREVHAFLHHARQNGTGEEGLTDFCTQVSKQCRILCFDEFHVSNIADAMILGRLFRTLHLLGVSCVMTSNRVPEDLYKGGLQADRFLPFITHVREHFEVIHLDSPTDYRLDRLRDQTLFMTPLSASTQKAMDVLFLKLSDGALPIVQIIDVHGRQLHIDGVHGIARTNFSELCEKPLGASDYLAMTERFHTLFLERVPKLTYDRRNEAMRLITLVDILYDKGTKLIVSAELPPEKLYVGTDHAFEFQRTVSRLLEMQSPGYFSQA